jgi:PAS domain S-box-containing protein
MVETLPAGQKKDALRLLHELDVHRIELEMQNAELRKARDELEAILEKYTDLYDFSPVAYFTLAKNSAIVESNLTGAMLLGIGRSLLTGRYFKFFVPDKERPAFIAFLDRVFSSEAKESYETALAKEGYPASFVRIEAVAGRSSCDCRMAVIDITERKQVEEELRDNEERYRRLFEMESDAILLVDQETSHFLDANIAAQKMYGYTLEEFLRLTACDLSAEPDKTWLVISAKQNWVPNRLHRKKDGKIFPVEIAGSYFEYKGRDVHVSSIRDITERTRSEGEIIAYQEELRSMASEISLVEERERRNIAIALHDQVGQILAMAGFKLGELRQAIAPGNLGAKVDEIREMLTQAIRNSRTLTFELSPPILYDLGLEAALCSLAERFRKEHGIRIDCRDDSQPKPLSDNMRILLFQGVRELLVNAVKHAHPRSITISCLRKGTDIRVVVEDDGAGFATVKGDILPGKTHGFGLFSLRERLKYLGGSIDIKSAPGHGARITLTAPLATEPYDRRE